MKKMLIAAILIVFCSPLMASKKPTAEPKPFKFISAVCIIWTDERLVSCAFVKGPHQDITVVETLPKNPSPLPEEISATYKKDGMKLAIPLGNRLAAKYSLTMKALYSKLNASHQSFKQLTAYIYTDGSVSVQEYSAGNKK